VDRREPEALADELLEPVNVAPLDREHPVVLELGEAGAVVVG
jgi:hypothetical protein